MRRLPGLPGRIPPGRRGVVLLSTIGSLGDLYPVLSVARALEAAGLEARLALPPDDCEVARDWGLEAHRVGPTRQAMCDRLGMTMDDIAASILRDPSPLLRDVLIPMLPHLVEQTRPMTTGVTTVAATTFALHAFLAGEVEKVPLVPLMLQPMLQFSALDPPRTGAFRATVARPRTPVGRAWNRTVMGAAHATLRVRHRRALTAVRHDLGLPPQPGTPLLDHGGDVALRLGLWDPAFAPPPGDAPEGLAVVGFPPSPPGTLMPHEAAWIENGPAPLVVTLGSIAQGLAGSGFWGEAAALARRMGLRAVLLTGDADAPEGEDVLRLRYAPHADLFPRAAALVHHGGIGTTAEAIRAAKPQLVVPVGGDQPDNAERLRRLGLAEVLPPARFDAATAAGRLEGLADRFDHIAAARLAAAVRRRDGAAEAALHLAGVALRA